MKGKLCSDKNAESCCHTVINHGGKQPLLRGISSHRLTIATSRRRKVAGLVVVYGFLNFFSKLSASDFALKCLKSFRGESVRFASKFKEILISESRVAPPEVIELCHISSQQLQYRSSSSANLSHKEYSSSAPGHCSDKEDGIRARA